MKITVSTTTHLEPGCRHAHSVKFELREYRIGVPTLPITFAEDSGVESSETGAPNPASLATRQLLLLERAVAELRESMRASGLLDEGVRV